MANIADYVSQLQSLTQKNLEILQALNDSFYTKKENLTVSVGDSYYTIPSFISLENKINALQENFDNLVYAPKTGEAAFNVDGNTKYIQMKGYTCTPERLSLDTTSNFSVENNNIFKDMLNPLPYVHFDIQSIPNDITNVNVRKVAIKNENLKSTIITLLKNSVSAKIDWADLYKILSIYTKDTDYVQYDTIRRLPLHDNIGYGDYIIKEIVNDYVDPNDLMEYVTMTLNKDLKYTLYNETIERYLEVGDYLVTYDDSAKMQITSLNESKRQITVKVVNGDYLNLVADVNDDTLASDNSRLKYFSEITTQQYQTDKYINVPLEEDQYICVFVSPLNDRMNIQAPWGTGVLFNTYELKSALDNSNFKDYYNNVKNIGDLLYEITYTLSSPIMKYTESEFKEFSEYQPIISSSTLKVMQINNHINSSTTVQNIRSLYSQKQEYKKQLDEVQSQITTINNNLSSIDYTDTTGIRQIYKDQLEQYNNQQNNLITSISKVITEINTAVNDSSVPLENAKYRIRGYYDFNIDDTTLNKYKKFIKGIEVQYRYKNQDNTTGSSVSIDDKFLFSDWNIMNSFKLIQSPYYENNTYKFKYTDQDNGNKNEPSFNQIDIPITQGETVDIKLRIIWDFGFPFIETKSNWSSIINIEFPEEYQQDIQLLDIIDENSKDYEDTRFKSMLINKGINNHVDDKLIDQDITYFHQPEHISSGFYTSERRVVPLKDKLLELSQSIISLQDIINNTINSNIDCSIIIDDIETNLYTNKENKFVLPAYSTTNSINETNGTYNPYSMQATIKLTNNSDHIINLYSMFPARENIELTSLKNAKYNISDYASGDDKGVWIGYFDNENSESSEDNINEAINLKIQTSNQWITFRIKDAYNNQSYYNDNSKLTNDILPLSKDDFEKQYKDLMSNHEVGMLLYPYISDINSLKINSDVYSSITLYPGDSFIVPIMVHYNLKNEEKTITKTICFDIRTSLYNEPKNYTINFIVNNIESVQEKLAKSTKSRLLNNNTTAIKYSSTIKN